MKHYEKMTAPNGTKSVTMHFPVQAICVLNPTAYTIACRFGALDVPNEIADADMYISGGSLAVYPVVGQSFAFGFTLPTLAFQPSGMPTEAQIIFIGEGEIIPTFGAIALSAIDANITNTSLHATIDNASLDVNVNGTVDVDIQNGSVNATITNATLDVDVIGSVNLPIQNASGDILNTYQNDPLESVLLTRMGIASVGSTDDVLAIASDYRSISLTNIHANVFSIRVTGNQSGIVYFDFPTTQSVNVTTFTINIFGALDTTFTIRHTRMGGISSEAVAYRVIGHRNLLTNTRSDEGYLVTRVAPNDYDTTPNLWFDQTFSGATALSVFKTYTAGLKKSVRLTSLYISSDGTTSAGTIRVLVDITDDSAITVGRVWDFRSVSTFSQVNVNCNLSIPAGHTIRVWRQNTDGSTRRITVFPYIEIESV